jgi:KTSC domain
LTPDDVASLQHRHDIAAYSFSRATMFRAPVSSSVVASIGYNEGTKTLEIEFVSGSVYRYFGVGLDVFEDFRDASSKGAFFNEHIKDEYPCERIK